MYDHASLDTELGPSQNPTDDVVHQQHVHTSPPASQHPPYASDASEQTPISLHINLIEDERVLSHLTTGTDQIVPSSPTRPYGLPLPFPNPGTTIVRILTPNIFSHHGSIYNSALYYTSLPPHQLHPRHTPHSRSRPRILSLSLINSYTPTAACGGALSPIK